MAEDYFGIVGTVQAGAYRVDKVVGEGGFAVVYRAFHDAFQAPVALKCLKIPQQMNSDHQQEFLTKFREEAALLFRLSASIPAVVRPLHVDRIITPDNRFVPFMALEWLEGEGLDQLILRRSKEGKPAIGMKKAVRLIAPVARALARAHHFPGPDGPISIVHRDLKPDNIFLARVNGEEVVKIFDFGIAKARSVATQVAGRVSQGGSMTAFTPGYGAPEQWLPKRFGQTGPWTDVFGLALTVLEAASGRPIIDGDTAGMMGTACDEKRRPTPRNEGLDVSDEVEAVFMAALAVDPRKRYPDAGTFWDALESALGLELSATPTISGNRIPRDARADGPPTKRVDRVSTPPTTRANGRGEVDSIPALAALSRSSAPPPPPRPEPIAPMAPLPSIPDIELGGPAPKVAPPLAKPKPEPARPAPAPPPTDRATTGSPLDDDGGPDLELAVDMTANNRPAPAPTQPRPQSGEHAAVRNQEMTRSGQHAAPKTSTPAESPPPAPARAGGTGRVQSQARNITPPSVRVAAVGSPIDRIRVPLGVGVAGVVLAIAEQLYISFVGPLDLPVRLTYVAGALICVGVVMVMKRLIFSDER